MLVWLIELSRQSEFRLINIHVYDDLPFTMCCSAGHLKIAEWLLQLSRLPEFGPIVIHESAFIGCCFNGHLEVAKWLISLGPIDIHIHEDFAFIASCYKGHLAVAKWLISLGHVNIHGINDLAFILACYAGRIEVAQWLIELCQEPEYGLIDIHTINEVIRLMNCNYSNFNVYKLCQSPLQILLYQLGSNGCIYIDHHYNESLPMAKWLVELSQKPPFHTRILYVDPFDGE